MVYHRSNQKRKLLVKLNILSFSENSSILYLIFRFSCLIDDVGEIKIDLLSFLHKKSQLLIVPSKLLSLINSYLIFVIYQTSELQEIVTHYRISSWLFNSLLFKVLYYYLSAQLYYLIMKYQRAFLFDFVRFAMISVKMKFTLFSNFLRNLKWFYWFPEYLYSFWIIQIIFRNFFLNLFNRDSVS